MAQEERQIQHQICAHKPRDPPDSLLATREKYPANPSAREQQQDELQIRTVLQDSVKGETGLALRPWPAIGGRQRTAGVDRVRNQRRRHSADERDTEAEALQ